MVKGIVAILKAKLKIEGGNKIGTLVEILCDCSTRQEWDSTIHESKLIKRYSKNLVTRLFVVKIPVLLMQNREFVEKMIVFRWKDAMYLYATSIDDSFSPIRSDMTRGKTLLWGTKITREGDSIIVQTVAQIDFKFYFSLASVSTKLATGLEKFRTELIAKLAKNKST